MTLFSYLVSELENSNFKEPHMLEILIQRLFPKQKKVLGKVEGWVLHYLVGLLFVAVYSEAWERNKLKPGAGSGFLFGALSSVPAVAIWDYTLKVHPLPPHINKNEFFKQLVIAHLVFGAFSGIGYKLAGENPD